MHGLAEGRTGTGTALRWLGWAGIGALVLGLAVNSAGPLWGEWHGDSSLSHAPLVPFISAGLLWMRRDRLRDWSSASVGGAALMCLAAFAHVLAVWADVVFLVPLSFIGLLLGLAWFLGGRDALRAAAGPIGFLVFLIPWPTTLVERLTFPMQLMSSTYAALLGGLMGIPVHRVGVELAVVPNPAAPPVYSMVVAQKCSGLNSLTVLLALGYLIALFTPRGWGWKALLVALVPPMALLCNATRLTAVLVAGAWGRPGTAQWIHDNEGPLLIFLCSLGLMGVRHLILEYSQRRPRPPVSGEEDAQAVPVIGG